MMGWAEMNEASSYVDLPVVGKPLRRIDGPLKVSGSARYASDFSFPEMVYAVPVCATVARAHIAAIDTAAAEAMAGVRKIYTRQNIGKFYRVSKASKAKIDEARPPLDDDEVRYYGQYVALVIADTFERATHAASLVRVRQHPGRRELAAVEEDSHLATVDVGTGGLRQRGNVAVLAVVQAVAKRE